MSDIEGCLQPQIINFCSDPDVGEFVALMLKNEGFSVTDISDPNNPDLENMVKKADLILEGDPLDPEPLANVVRRFVSTGGKTTVHYTSEAVFMKPGQVQILRDQGLIFTDIPDIVETVRSCWVQRQNLIFAA